MCRRVWEVDLLMEGPLSIKRNMQFRQEKGFDLENQFYSDVQLENHNLGIQATITAYAPNVDMAVMAAHVYYGKMTDVLSYENDIPIYLSNYNENVRKSSRYYNRRLLKKDDFKRAFNVARRLEIDHPKILRAIGWYSKGNISQNTFDQFLAYWNVIEIIGKSYFTETERTNDGVKNMIYQCFIDRFGDINTWGLPELWIDNMYDIRNRIVHGGADTSVESISDISMHIPLLRRWSKKLLDKLILEFYRDHDFSMSFW